MSARAENIAAMSRDEHRAAAADHLGHVAAHYRTTSEGRALFAIAHALLALTAPEEKP